MPKVSIIVPVYNGAEYISKCLDSLINQTLTDIEIIVVNDGSVDETEAIVKKYQINTPNIVYFKKNNTGLGDTRNFGISKASAPYVGFVDSDDYVDKTMFEKMYNIAIKNNSDVVECDFYWVYPDKKVLDQANYYNEPGYINALIRVMACNKLIKRELIIKNNVTFAVGLKYEDIAFTYKLLPYASRIDYLNEPLYYYVQRSNSLVNDQNGSVADIFKILTEVDDYYRNYDILAEHKDLLEYINLRYLLGSSFLRILGVKDKIVRKKLLADTWEYLNKNYPNWKQNKYLNLISSKNNKYYRIINKPLFYLFANLIVFKRGLKR